MGPETNEIKRVIEMISTDFKISKGEFILEICPFCQATELDNRFKFYVNMETGLFQCKRGSCGAKGNLYQLSQQTGIPLDREALMSKKIEFGKPVKQYQKPYTKVLPLSLEGRYYLNNRGLFDATIDYFKVGSDENKNIVFPFFRNDQLVFVKKRPLDHRDGAKEFPDKDTEPILFGMDEIKCEYGLPLVITEGMIDAMSVVEAGYPCVVSVPMGSNNLNWIELCWDFLNQFANHGIIIWADSDKAGQKMLSEISKRLDHLTIRVVKTEYLDANEALQNEDHEYVTDLISHAQIIRIDGVRSLSEIKCDRPWETEHIKSLFPTLNKSAGGYRLGSLCIWSGQPQSGKTTALNNEIGHTLEQDYRVAVFSAELSVSGLKNWLLCPILGRNYLESHMVNGCEMFGIRPDIEAICDEHYADKVQVYDHSFLGTSEKTIIETFKQLRRRYGVKVFVLDNLMTVHLQPDIQGNLNQSQKRFINRLHDFVIEYECVVHLVAHERKDHSRKDLTTISGALEIVNIAEMVFGVERPNSDDRDQDEESSMHSIAGNRDQGNLTGEGIIRIKKNRFTGICHSFGILHELDHRICEIQNGMYNNASDEINPEGMERRYRIHEILDDRGIKAKDRPEIDF